VIPVIRFFAKGSSYVLNDIDYRLRNSIDWLGLAVEAGQEAVYENQSDPLRTPGGARRYCRRRRRCGGDVRRTQSDKPAGRIGLGTAG
jgi:hypothetical protein